VRIASLLSLAVALAATAISWGTLCLGEDGHMAFEPSLAGGCAAPDRASGTEPLPAAVAGLAGRPQCCGPCMDLPGASGEWFERSPARRPDPGPLAHTGLCLPAWAAQPARASVPLALAASARLARRAITLTTVLHC
jgi:hypothetical protein